MAGIGAYGVGLAPAADDTQWFFGWFTGVKYAGIAAQFNTTTNGLAAVTTLTFVRCVIDYYLAGNFSYHFEFKDPQGQTVAITMNNIMRLGSNDTTLFFNGNDPWGDTKLLVANYLT